MPLQYPGNQITKEARARAGGGFESDIEASGGGSEFTPLVTRSFNNGVVGESASSEFDNWASTAVYASAAPRFDGSTYINTRAVVGSDNTFSFGGLLDISPAVYQGGEIWVRQAIYSNDRFWEDSAPYLKFMRLNERAGDGSPSGYADIYIENSVRGDPEEGVHFVKEGVSGSYVAAHGLNRAPDLDAWTVYEFYIKLHSDPSQGRARLWRNNELIIDATTQTLNNADGYCSSFLLFTYWNNTQGSGPGGDGPTEEHVVGVDQIEITTNANPPANTDAAGHPYIGGSI